MKNLVFLFIFIFSAVATSQAQLILSEGYIPLKESPANGRPMEIMILKLDDDAIEDTAMIAESPGEFSKYMLLIWLSKHNKQVNRKLDFEDDLKIYPIQLTANKNVLQFGYCNDGTAHVCNFFKLRYNKAARKMQVIGYDGGYSASISERIDKSYNLLTGQFEIIRSQPGENEQAVIKSTKGKTTARRNLYLQNLNAKIITDLSWVGEKRPADNY